MAALTTMPRSVAEHEIAHLIGAAIAYMGETPRMKHFCEAPRYHDANVFLGFDTKRLQGEFAITCSKHVAGQPEMRDDVVALIRRSSAVAPIGLVHDRNRIMRSVGAARHWADILTDFSDILSPEDRSIATKGGKLTISSHEELVGIFAFDAMKAVAPDRLNAIVGLTMRHNGSGGTQLLRKFVPRALANDVLKEALRTAKTCFALAHA